MIKKKIIYFYIILILIFTFLIFILNIFSKKFIIKNYGSIYSSETLKTYKKYYGTVNHLRNPWKNDNENLIFTKIGSGKKSIIFQGDSWSENLIRKKKTLLEFSKKNNFKLYLAGTISYSPSIYNAQLDLLLNEFNIKPNIIVTFFDHTDIGDELCRYKNSLTEENGKFIVKPYEKLDQQFLFNLENTFNRLELLNSNNFSLIILLKLSFIVIKERFIDNREGIKCDSNKIIEYLKKGISKDERNYIVNLIRRYFYNILKIQELEKFIIVTHPHKEHINNNYILKIDDLINEALNKIQFDERIYILDFNIFARDFLINKNVNEMFLEQDLLSHLNEDYYDNYYVDKILNKISKNN